MDVLFQTNEYPDLCNVKSTPLLPSFQVDSRDIIVPTTESILGDKITTLAPNTIGIPYFKGDKNRGLEIAKQIYDTGNLFDETVDFEKVKQSFINTALKEIDYHGCTAGLESVIEDCFLFSRMICIRDQSDPGFSIVQKGISRLAGFLLNRRFYIEEVIISLSKAAIILAGIKSGSMEIKKYNELESINDFTIKNPDFSKLNKLKKILPEAFYYWHKALQLKGIE